jgi:hypothetical protein
MEMYHLKFAWFIYTVLSYIFKIFLPELMSKPMIMRTEKAVIPRISGRNRKSSFKYLQSVHFHHYEMHEFH